MIGFIRDLMNRNKIEGKIGYNTKVWRWSHISKGAVVGNNCMIGSNVYIGPNVIIGNHCRIQNGVYIPEGVVIGCGVFIGPNTTFINDKYVRVRYSTEFKKYYADVLKENYHPVNCTNIGECVTIGANCTISTVNIGGYAVVGMASFVDRDLPRNCLAFGHPVEIIQELL